MKKLCGLVTFNNEEHWRKFVITVAMAFAVFTNGWFSGLMGAALPDLQYVMNTDLQQISVLLSLSAVGRMSGGLTLGYLYDLTQSYLLLLSAMTCFGGLSTAALPWSHFYGVFLAIAICCGFSVGGINCGYNTKLAVMWGTEGRQYMQFLHFSYAVGGIISPLAAAPFFAKTNTEQLNLTQGVPIDVRGGTNVSKYEYANEADPWIYGGSAETEDEIITNTTNLTTSELVGQSHIHYPFAMTGGLYILASIWFLALRCMYSENSTPSNQREPIAEARHVNSFSARPLSSLQTCCFLFVLFWVYICSISAECMEQSYLSTFVIRQLQWNPSLGAILVSVLWASFGFGRLLGIFIARYLSPASMIYMSFSGMFLTSLGQFAGGYLRKDYLIWIFVPLMGVSMSAFAPCLVVWLNENLITVTGKVASGIVVTSSLATLTFPLYVGVLIDKFSPMGFVYVQTAESLGALILFTILVVGVKLAKPAHDQTPTETTPILHNGNTE